MDLVLKKLDELKPYPNNPRVNEQAVDSVAESIRQCEYVSPIVVDENDVILAGHTRLKALQKLGESECEVVVKSGLTDEQKRKYRLLDNKTGELAEWDFNRLAAEIDGLDFGDLDLDWGMEDIDGDEFGTDFELADDGGPKIITMTLTLSREQADTIKAAIDAVGDECENTFGNGNKNGNAVYEIVRQWAEQKT